MEEGQVLKNWVDRVTILIVTWRRDDLLEDCLASMLRVYGELPHVVVVDNDNAASTHTLVDSYGVQYVATEGNLGFAGGNMAGFPLCNREFVLLLNNDTIFESDSIAPLLAFMDLHPNAAVAQGRSVFAAEHCLLDGCGMEVSPIGQLVYPGLKKPLGGDYDRTRPMPAAGGPFCLFRRAALPDIGGELYHSCYWAYFEDVDLSFRSWRGGWEVWFVSTPPILHRQSMTSKMFTSDYVLRHFYFNTWMTYLTCFDWYGWIRFIPLFCLSYVGKGVLRLMKGDAGYFSLHISVLAELWRKRGEVRRIRRTLKPCRKLSDRALVKALVRKQPWAFYRDAFGVGD